MSDALKLSLDENIPKESKSFLDFLYFQGKGRHAIRIAARSPICLCLHYELILLIADAPYREFII